MSNSKKKAKAPIKQGKVAKSRKKSGPISYDEVFGNPEAMPDELMKELEDQGLVGRWLNAKATFETGGVHKRGWRIYIRKNCDKLTEMSRLGSDPEGVVRRGDLILGYKTQEAVDLHRRWLKQERERLSLDKVRDKQVKELRELAKDADLDLKIDSDFD